MVSCSRAQAAYFEQYREVMGTIAQIKIIHRDRRVAQRAAEQAFREMTRVDSVFSLWKERSEISQINRLLPGKPFLVSHMMLELICCSNQAYRDSDGAFDPTILPLAMLWKNAIQNEAIPSADEILQFKKSVGWKNIVLKRDELSFRKDGMGFDFGGIAKGYAVDRAVSVLRRYGIRCFIVAISGDMYAGGSRLGRPWVIGIRHPRNEGDVIESLVLRDQAVSTSADTEQFVIKGGRRFHHLIDPRSGWPAQGVASVTVVASRSVIADAYSTAFFIMGLDETSGFLDKNQSMRAIFYLDGAKGLSRHEIPRVENSKDF